MARMHSPRKGKSGSHRPVKKTVPSWVQYSADEVKELVIKKYKKGNPTSIIGVTLRDQYGIPSVKTLVGKSISDILKIEGLYPKYPEDLMNLLRKSVKLRKHLENNKQDVHNKRNLQLTESKIRRLVRYYKSTNVLPKKWYYKPDEVALIIKG